MRIGFLPLLLLIVPIVEIAAFIMIGGQIGIGMTLLMILVTAVIGTFFLRQQGLQLLNKIQSEIGANRVPGKALGEGAMILVAGILLLTPGFVTDAIGFLLFVPFVRNAIWAFLASRITLQTMGTMGGGFSNMNPQGGPFDPTGQSTSDISGDGPVIDLDADEYSSGTPNPSSPWNKDKE